MLKRTFTSDYLLKQAQASAELTRALHDSANEAAARIATLEAALAQKQRAIDGAASQWTSSIIDAIAVASAMYDILRPEATPTDAKPQADALPPIGQHHPDDPLVTEWTEWGFKITKQPEEWRKAFREQHAGILVVSFGTPAWSDCADILYLRGLEGSYDEQIVVLRDSDRARVWAAIVSLNAKHRKTQPNAILVDHGWDRQIQDAHEEASQPAQPEPSGDSLAKRVDALERMTQELASAHRATFPPDQRIVGLVKTLARVVQAMAVRSQLSCQHEVLDVIIAECGDA